jgi:predicted N-acetyltransferase YhbS
LKNNVSLTVRTLASSSEYATYFRLADAAFSSQASEESAQGWQQYITRGPEFRPEQLRGVFLDGEFVGGLSLFQRSLRMGEARLLTGCIGAVVTSPDFRLKGVARALLQDTFEEARRSGCAFLLLDGIPKFYHRYGYIDMFDASAVEVDRAAILAEQPHPYHIRSASAEDAAAVLALYNRHPGVYTGSFEQPLEWRAYRLGLPRRQRSLVVAVTAQGKVEGYLQYEHGDADEGRALGREIAADNWDALHALLYYHAHQYDVADPPTVMRYLLPINSPITYQIIDRLEVPDTSRWHSAAQQWGVQSMSYHHRFTGWMACLVNFHQALQAALPELQARWKRGLAEWNGNILFTVNGESALIVVSGSQINIVSTPDTGAYRVELTPQAFVQLFFGYRPLAVLTDLSSLPTDAQSALAILFPVGHTWIPSTDWF